MKTQRTRRVLGVVAAASVSAIVLAGCAGSDAGGADGDVTLTLMAWANSDEAKMYEEVLAAFEKENPGVTVNLEYSDVGSYQDKLNTKFAAGSPPDVFFMVGGWIGEYTSRDALLDYAEYADIIDFDAMDQNLVAGSTSEDGKVFSIPTGSTAAAIVANTGVIDELGVDLPDDATWSWEDFSEWAQSVTEASGGATYGSFIDMSWPPTISAFARQHGENLFNEDGTLGITEETALDWFELTQELIETQAFAPPETQDQTGAQSAEQSPFGRELIATTVIPANTLPSNANVLGDDNVKLLRYPGETEFEQPGMAVTPTLLWTSPATTKHPEETAKLVEFLTNDPASYDARGTFLGVPINAEVAEQVAADLTPSEEQFVSFVTDLSQENLAPNIPDPANAGEVTANLTAIMTELSFGRISPEEAAQKFIADSDALLAE
ncbi:ABC transporter substrate-binding protein [Microbacterium trichothecenolyticum]|uniref:ABC transporter substrate-binding protein n=1 Tax=Microbacterium trichothecenolyticum TaxID=69370 RepID=UPI0035BE90F5